jgi:hypothetical protein
MKQNQDGKWACVFCGLATMDKTNCVSHVEFHHVQEYTYTCDYCDLEFTAYRPKLNHINRFHREENRLAKLMRKSSVQGQTIICASRVLPGPPLK